MVKNPYYIIANKLFFASLWYFLATCLGLSLFFAFFRLDYILSFVKYFKKELAVSIIIGIVFRFVYPLFSFTWNFFSGATSKAVYYLLSLSYKDAFLLTNRESPVIQASGFGAKIFSPCSGVEGMTLFLTLFIIVMVIEWRFIKLPNALFLLVTGTFGVFLLNILRVYFILLLGIEISAEFALGFFHSNVGWLLFSAYFLVFEFLTYNWMRKEKVKSAKEIKL